MDDYDDIDNNPFIDPAEDSSQQSFDGEHITDEEATASGSASNTNFVGEQANGNQEKNVPPGAAARNDRKTEDPVKTIDQDIGDILPERSDKVKKYTIVIKVVGLQRAGTVINKKENPTIIFDLSTNLPLFRKQNYKMIKKTMDEFHQLFKYLNAAIQESFIPALPLPFTNYGINNREDLEKTVRNFQSWFNRLSKNPLVLKNEEFVHFIECDHNTYIPIKKYSLIATGLKRKTLKQLAPPYDETLNLAEFRPVVKSIHWNAKELQSRLLNISKIKKMLSQYENSFGKGFISLSDFAKKTQDSDHHQDKKSILYNHFGKIMTTVGDIDSIIATLDIATLYDGLEWIVNDTYVVKEALTDRHLLMRELSKAQQNTKSKQDQARKLRAKRDTSPIKVDESIRQLKDASKLEQQLTLKVERVTANMLLERKEWIEWYESQLKQSIKEYTLRKIEYERKKLALLERVRVDVRNADSHGGLSRLGREHLNNPNVTLNTDTSSQAEEGDSWTGENRKRDPKSVENMNHTEFDKAISTEELTQINNNVQQTTLLDPRSAATLLGECTF